MKWLVVLSLCLSLGLVSGRSLNGDSVLFRGIRSAEKDITVVPTPADSGAGSTPDAQVAPVVQSKDVNSSEETVPVAPQVLVQDIPTAENVAQNIAIVEAMAQSIPVAVKEETMVQNSVADPTPVDTISPKEVAASEPIVEVLAPIPAMAAPSQPAPEVMFQPAPMVVAESPVLPLEAVLIPDAPNSPEAPPAAQAIAESPQMNMAPDVLPAAMLRSDLADQPSTIVTDPVNEVMMQVLEVAKAVDNVVPAATIPLAEITEPEIIVSSTEQPAEYASNNDIPASDVPLSKSEAMIMAEAMASTPTVVEVALSEVDREPPVGESMVSEVVVPAQDIHIDGTTARAPENVDVTSSAPILSIEDTKEENKVDSVSKAIESKKAPEPAAEVPVPSTEAAAPSTEAPSSSTGAPVSSSEAPSSSEATMSSTEVVSTQSSGSSTAESASSTSKVPSSSEPPALSPTEAASSVVTEIVKPSTATTPAAAVSTNEPTSTTGAPLTTESSSTTETAKS